MLKSLELRASWSNTFLFEQLRALEDASDGLAALADKLPGAPLPDVRAPRDLPDAAALQALRDEGDGKLCALIDWLAVHRGETSADSVAWAEAILDDYLNRQSRHELATSAKPMFVEISAGAEKD